MSFTVASAENITHTKPLARSDLYLTCKGYQVKGASVINVEKPSYLEGTGEQVEFAIISLGDASDGLKVFFDSWGFSPFGLIESHVMHEHWSLVHVGGRVSVKGEKIDYSFVDNQPQEGGSYKPKTGVFLYGCVFHSIRSRIGIEVRSAIRIHSINRELNFFYRFLTR
ncbi:hypothetical protein OYC18_24565, partial [Escherichia coli]|nr:hypothetical protein [Escherichia coli]